MDREFVYRKAKGAHFFSAVGSHVCIAARVTVFVLFCLMERMINSLLTLTPGFRAVFNVKAVAPTLPTMRTATSSLKEFLTLTTEGCLIGELDQLCGFLDVECYQP